MAKVGSQSESGHMKVGRNKPDWCDHITKPDGVYHGGGCIINPERHVGI